MGGEGSGERAKAGGGGGDFLFRGGEAEHEVLTVEIVVPHPFQVFPHAGQIVLQSLFQIAEEMVIGHAVGLILKAVELAERREHPGDGHADAAPAKLHLHSGLEFADHRTEPLSVLKHRPAGELGSQFSQSFNLACHGFAGDHETGQNLIRILVIAQKAQREADPAGVGVDQIG